MNSFFNNYFNIRKIIADKREYKRQMERVKALPEDYRYVYKKITGRMWQFAAGDGLDMLEVQYGLIDLFEEGAADNKPVCKITGEDVASFTDELLKSAKTYDKSKRDKLNRDVAKKLRLKDGR